jgi:hypothetical protein
LRRCLKETALGGGIAALGGGLLLTMFPVPDAWRTLLQVQVALGGALLVGAALSSLRTEIAPAFLCGVGLLLLGLVAWYPFFMNGAVAAFKAGSIKRIAHPPGLLAVASAFAARALLDYSSTGEDRRRRLAPLVGKAGLVIGGALDAFVLYLVVRGFRS